MRHELISNLIGYWQSWKMVNIYNSNFQIFQLRVNTKFYIFWQNVNSIFLLFGQRKVWLVKMWNKKKTSTKCLWVIKTLILLKQLGKENIWPSSLFKYMLKYSCHFTVKLYHICSFEICNWFARNISIC